MSREVRWVAWIALIAFLGTPAWGQETVLEPSPVSQSVASESASTDAASTEAASTEEDVPSIELPQEVIDDTRERIEDIAGRVNQDERAQEVSAGILQPIYSLAEYLAFPSFHWVAFAIMVTGVVSFALQLVLAKLVVLSKFGFSLTEILSDALGLAISLVGLVLTTQAAAQNSNFTDSPAGVLSAAGLGILGGFVFYVWGQSQEVQAVKGRSQESKEK